MNLSSSRPFFPALLLVLCAVAISGTEAQAQKSVGQTEPSVSRCPRASSLVKRGPVFRRIVFTRYLQTYDGYLWTATEGGIARFNGIQFTVFNQENDPAFTSNDTCCLAEDRNKHLWIGTSDGLLRYAEGAFHRYTEADGLPSSVVLSIAPTGDGFLLVLTSGGLARYDGQKFIPLTSSASALGFPGRTATYGLRLQPGFSAYSQEHLHAVPVSGLPAEPIEGLGSLRDGSLWVRTRTTVLLWNKGRLRTWRSGHGSCREHVSSRSSQTHVGLSGSAPIKVLLHYRLHPQPTTRDLRYNLR